MQVPTWPSGPISLRAPAHFPGWLPNRFYSLHPLDFVVTIGSVLRPYGLSTTLWAHRPSGLLATPGRRV